jgi:membrane-associated phospholipid phosphatase
MLESNNYWQLITHLGSASLLLPFLGIAVIKLWLTRQKKALFQWIIALILGILITLTSKVLFFGWGIGIASIDFTGVSGHTFLATSVIPILFYLFPGGSQESYKNTGLWIGLILSFLIGVSRITLGMHSISEVISGWLLGLYVCKIALSAIKFHYQRYSFLQLTLLALLLTFGSTTPNYLPTHDLEMKLALYLSGHDKPFTRLNLNLANHQGTLLLK